MQEWIDHVCAVGGQISGNGDGRPLPERLARLHNTFEQVHPFIDGNGRTGRLILNLVLVRLGYPPVIIFKRQRDAYLMAMQRADAALRQAAQRGRLDAFQGSDGVWRSSRRAVEIYRSSRHRRKPRQD